MTFAFLKHLFGEEQAGSVMNGMEYAPHTDPDWDPFSIVWKVSPEETSAAGGVRLSRVARVHELNRKYKRFPVPIKAVRSSIASSLLVISEHG